MDKIIRVATFINSKAEKKLLKEVDESCKKNYMSRSRFTKIAWRTYLAFLKNNKYD
jgi:metal-responsive CopG/Arc/MetJ family transcriptional regulator